MCSEKDGHLYTNMVNLIVIELLQEELATKEDIACGIDKWVCLFKAKTWEDLKMVAQDNPYMTSTVESMYLSNTDRNILKVAREREGFLRSQAYKDKKLETQAAEIKTLTSENNSLTSEIDRLRKLLADNGISS